MLRFRILSTLPAKRFAMSTGADKLITLKNPCCMASTATTASFPKKKVLVFGGNGYVGQQVCKEALKESAEVISVNRSGRPSNVTDSWVDRVKWVKADVFDGPSYEQEIVGVDGCVSCIGAFGTNEFMEKINGDANIYAVEQAKKANVKQFVYVSTVENNLPDFFLQGYFHGKRRAEKAVLKNFSEHGIVLRPGFIYGTRQAGNLSVPLWIVGKPLASIFNIQPFVAMRSSIPGMKAILAPPISVETIGKVAVKAALGNTKNGILDTSDIAELGK